MKKKFSYKDIIFKSKRLAALCLVVVFSAGLALTSGMNSDIPVHDGDVLVDSLAVSEKEAVSGKTQAQGGDDGDSESADNAANTNKENAAQTQSFEEMRASLELERNKLISTLDSTINNSENEAEKANASANKEKIMDYMENELAIESLIKAKNLPESFVMITDSSVSVSVDKQELDSNTVAKICDIAMRETGKTADKIVIQSKY